MESYEEGRNPRSLRPAETYRSARREKIKAGKLAKRRAISGFVPRKKSTRASRRAASK